MIRIMDDMQHCTGCGACDSVCPAAAIRMEPDIEGFLFPVIDEARCTECGLCRRTCPVNGADAVSAREQGKETPATYACWAVEDGLRLSSSSGGAFAVLSQQVIAQDGIVFGAAFEGPKKVGHRSADTMAQLDALRRSKYVQSETGNAYRDVKSALASGRKVLFCGTPCQVAGLHAVLGKRPEALLSCDFVCSGVPSPKVWRLHVEELERKYGGQALGVSFRDKTRGWRGNGIRISFDNGACYDVRSQRDAFFIGFGKELFNRKSCCACRFRTLQSVADITLGDFWGIWTFGKGPAAYRDNQGVSLVMTHGRTGAHALEETEGCLSRIAHPYGEAESFNPRMTTSRPASVNRAPFFAALQSGIAYRKVQQTFMDNTSPVFHLKRFLRAVLPSALMQSAHKWMRR